MCCVGKKRAVDEGKVGFETGVGKPWWQRKVGSGGGVGNGEGLRTFAMEKVSYFSL